MWVRKFYLVSLILLLSVDFSITDAHSQSVGSEEPVAPPPEQQVGMTRIKLFLVALDDGGRLGKKIGCNDSLVPVSRVIQPTRAPLKAALKLLLEMPEKYSLEPELYNALYRSKLSLKQAYVRKGNALIYLSGQLILGGVCDHPRVEAQLEETVLQFSTVKQVKIYINRTPLADILSLE